MSDYNACTFTGRLGGDVEIRYTTGGQAVANFSMACGETWKDKDGNKKERTEWIKVVLWGKLGEVAAEYLSKGSKVLISGKLQTRSWDDKEGNKKYTTEIVANNMVMLGGGEKKGGSAAHDEPPAHDDDDLPF